MTKPMTAGKKTAYNRLRQTSDREARNAYVRAHRAVTRERGHASRWPCMLCLEPAAEWALIPDADGVTRSEHYAWHTDTIAYIPLCAAHHRLMDAAHRAVADGCNPAAIADRFAQRVVADRSGVQRDAVVP